MNKTSKGLWTFFLLLISWTAVPADAAIPAPPPDTIRIQQQTADQSLFRSVLGYNGTQAPRVSFTTSSKISSDGSYVQVIDAPDQTGGIWTNDQPGADLRMDLTKDFDAEMYLYFGDRSTQVGDGMALVWQADPRGTNAIAVSDGQGGLPRGAQLGMAGIERSTDSNEINSKYAIQKSFALEFDMYKNSEYMDQDVADSMGDTNADIAFAFPGGGQGDFLPSGYSAPVITREGFFQWTKVYHTSQHHYQPQIVPITSLTDGTWKRFKISWNAETNTFSYELQLNQNEVKTASISFDPVAVFGKNKDIYWGLTGSTGAYYMEGALAFRNIAGLLDTNTQMTITDPTGKDVNGQEIPVDLPLTYTIKGNYVGGNYDRWSNLKISVPVPDQLSADDKTFAESLTGQIGDKTFTAADIDSSVEDGRLNIRFNDPSWAILAEQPLSLHFTLLPEKAGHVQQAVEIQGDYATRSSQVYQFSVVDKPPMIDFVGIDPTIPLSIKTDQPITIQTKLDPGRGTIASVTYQINNLKDHTLSTPAKLSQTATIDLKSHQLDTGNYEVLVSLTNSYGKTATNSVQLNVEAGNLTLDQVADFSFSSIPYPELAKEKRLTLPPSEKQPMQLKVTDRRYQQDPWKLVARLTDFTIDGKAAPIEAILTIQLPDTKEIALKKDQPIVVYENPKGGSWTSSIDQAQLNFSSLKAVLPGAYQATIEWQVVDANH
ncbi:hypothetical protein NRIC_10010 [Enterococcus florum]|uniref:WxL domain-containing protein n=1 Tax=Enterococcus florum TaxID=2480627 RepID=A0A4P5P5Y4_9ENTE|nr:hypothetical protein [Enterococcus florum]GCF93110.1 hypothetical protein NRIC_10010 [Enterococcus florum]